MSDSMKKRILLVEDEAIVAMTEKMQLEKYGYSVRTVTTGENAIEAVKTSPEIDLILMDINLGNGIDGTQAAEIILKEHDIPIVFLSSHTEPAIVEKTEKITSYGYVVKSSSITVLDASIKMAFKLFDAQSAHKQTEESLQVSEQRLALATQSADLGIWDWDIVNNALTWNQQMFRMYGVADTADEHGVELWVSALHPEDKEFAMEAYQAALRGEKDYDIDFRVRRADGSVRYVHGTAVVIWAEDGTPVRMIGINDDITARKQTEDALRESERQLRQVMDLVPHFVFAKDTDGKYLLANAAVAEVYGTTPEELVGKSDYDFSSNTEETDFFLECDRKVIESGTGLFGIEETITDSTGARRYLETTKIPFTVSGSETPAILAVSVDITDRKRSQQDNELQSKLLQNIGQAVIATDPQGTVFYWNQMAETVYGWSSEEASGKNILDLTPSHETKEQAADIMRKLCQGETWSGEFVVQRKDGSSFPAHVTDTPILNDNGDLTGIIGVSTDITERQRAEEVIEKQLSEKETLLREVHHRVKNNMATIESFLSLQAGSTGHAEVRSALQDGISRVQSMRVLYDKLLLSTDLHEVSMKSYAEDLISSLLTVFNPEHTVTTETHITDFKIGAKQAFSLGIIINELLTNVFKYAFESGDSGTVSISIEKEDSSALLTIQDNGVGFDERALRNESPGFGLTVVKMLVEETGGTYSISNANGAKSIVRFEL